MARDPLKSLLMKPQQPKTQLTMLKVVNTLRSITSQKCKTQGILGNGLRLANSSRHTWLHPNLIGSVV